MALAALNRNAFNFIEHTARMGLIDANGKATITSEQAADWARKHKCATVTMTRRGDGRTIEVNAHALDDQAQWKTLGYELPPGPVVADPLAENARLKMEVSALNEKLNALIAGLDAKKGK